VSARPLVYEMERLTASATPQVTAQPRSCSNQCELAEATGEVWAGYRDRALRRTADEPPDDSIPRVLEITTSASTVIGGEDEGYVVTTSILLGVDVRPARPDEIEAR
jgi:hypothetical protein